jgi:hypothetical protein
MVQDVGVVATRFFEGVGENRQEVEGPVLVDPSGKDPAPQVAKARK